MGALLGGLAARLPIEACRTTDINLEIAFPELSARERLRLRRKSLAHTGRTLFELSFIFTRRPDRVAALITEVVGEAIVREAIDSGRGVIVSAPHLGSWELVLAYCSQNYPMTTLYRTPRILALGEWFRKRRLRFGTQLSTAEGGARPLMKALKNGEIAGVASDQDAGGGAGIFVPLFGKLANTMLLGPRLAEKTGALVVMPWAERLPGSRGYKLHFTSVSPEVNGNDLIRSATAINIAIESAVRSKPEQWLWSYKRYRVRPAGFASPYDGRITEPRSTT